MSTLHVRLDIFRRIYNEKLYLHIYIQYALRKLISVLVLMQNICEFYHNYQVVKYTRMKSRNSQTKMCSQSQSERW